MVYNGLRTFYGFVKAVCSCAGVNEEATLWHLAISRQSLKPKKDSELHTQKHNLSNENGYDGHPKAKENRNCILDVTYNNGMKDADYGWVLLLP